MVLFLLGVYKYYEYKLIKERNIILYSNIKCISECPLVFNETYNKNIIQLSCQKECSKISDYSLIDRFEKKTIDYSKEFNSCVEIYPTSQSFEEVQTCFKEILPKLREKYSYLK